MTLQYAHRESAGSEAPNPLADFLRAHRARITPVQAGIPSYGTTRRVPGLRREELAQLAGVSVNYYTRLEQGEAKNPSEGIITSLARALDLDEDATSYLHSIAGTTPPTHGTVDPGASEAGMSFTFERLVEYMPGTAAITLSATNDVLSCNHLAHQLFFAHMGQEDRDELGARWNTHRLLFTDPYTRDLYRHWHEEAALAVASLRFHAASAPDDAAVQALVGELCVTSSEFARLWAEHPVRRCTRGTKHLIHPGHGDLDLEYQVLHAPGGDGRRILIHTTTPGSPAADALHVLS
ncbi:helix-turn-helix transcriptional regulator [Nesterenkonia xinjiangensis]|uniref:Transcriptional regulator with XRE-family HTH domain n=1 Tax=Nesterenkonia xinjiangensis TaxID=225327 RepID=A0A7Z0GKA3_9MICC|nr:helix-turn-helix transcriptional regulator [Nesterenkonia xinjiangensis]NYJ77564.1 transcriptional regulator with XRE-family HTH domain [Nesterenkonia xinjiangensis]